MTMLAFSVLAAAFDCKTYKIPNALCGGMILTGLCMTAYQSGFEALRLSFAGIVIPFTMLYLLFYCGMIGGGDIKLLCGIGTFVGTRIVLITALSFLLNGIIAAGKLCMNQNLRQRLWSLIGYVQDCGEQGRLLSSYPSDEASRMHFSLGILGAVMIVYLAGL